MNIYLHRTLSLGVSYRMIAILIFLSILTTLTEMFGIGMLLPIFQFIKTEGDLNALVESTDLWVHIITFFDFINLEPSLIPLLVVGFFLFLLKQIFTYINLVYSNFVAQKITQDLRNRLFHNYMYADSHYHDSMPIGDLVNIMLTEVNSAIRGAMLPIELIVQFFMLLGYFSILLFISWKVTVIAALLLLIASNIPKIWIKKTKELGRKFVSVNTLLSEFLHRRIHSPRLIRLASSERAEVNSFMKLTRLQREHSFELAKLNSKVEVVMEPIMIGIIMAFLYVANSVLSLSIEVIGLFLLVSIRLLPIIKGIITKWQALQRYLGSIEAIESRFKEMKMSKEVDTGNLEMEDICNIQYKNVDYSYSSNDSNVLTNISININKGDMIAIVGPSGSGKSTFIDLLPRIRSPINGEILINNVNLRQYTLTSLRKLISYATQTTQIFEGTVKQHILYGKPDATNEEITKAAQLAGADSFINAFSDGYDTKIGENAIKLSGGQRQRLDLARALVKESSVLMLDEPTSSLDDYSEKSFIKTINRINKETDIIIIIISHRLSSVIDVDNIVVLREGVIEAIGTHKELLNASKWYSKAFEKQS